MSAAPSLLDTVLRYSELGWRVIPVQRGTKQPCVQSVLRWKQEEPDRATRRRWFADGQNDVAVLAGEPSEGLVVRDFDDPEAYQRWADSQPSLAQRLPTSRTGRGFHVYFLCDLSDVQDLSPSGRRIVFLGDGELRADALTKLPPSWHESGRQYDWLIKPYEDVPYISDPWRAGLAISWGAAEEIPLPSATEAPGPIYLTQENSGELMENTGDPIRSHREEKSPPNLVQKLDPNLAWMPDNDFDEWIEASITATQPTGTGQRHHRLFNFIRVLKSHPDSESWRKDICLSIARRWHARALPFIGTKDWLVTRQEFLDGWERVKFCLGKHLLPEVVRSAIENGCPPEVAADIEGQPSGLAAAICRELARHNGGDGGFYLACRELGEHIGQSHTTANVILRGLCSLGLIELVKPGTRTLANEYRYLGKL